MPYDPNARFYQGMDEQIAFRHQPGTPRHAQVLPRKNYDPTELARLARHQARVEATQKSRVVNTHTQAALADDGEDNAFDDYPQSRPILRRYDVDQNGIPFRQRRVDHFYNTPLRQPAAQPAEPVNRRRIHIHWLVYAGIALLLLITGWIAYAPITTAWQMHQDDVTYGTLRTFQIDAVVGHSDSATNPSHFTAENLKGQIIIIEFPGGDVTKARSYTVTTIPGNEGNPPVRLSFQDINHDGKLDMVILIGEPGNTMTIFSFNNGTQFVSKL